MQPSSGQHTQIKYLQCAYNLGSHSVYNYDIYMIQTIVKNVYVIHKYMFFNNGLYHTYITILHTMGSHIVRTLKVLDLCKLA